MIRFFPDFYPDELVYSLLARYYARSGYLAYTYAAEDLFLNKSVRPDMDFVNAYTNEALQLITRGKSMEDVVLDHTMFPCYGHFMPKERRLKAFESLVTMQGNYHNLMPIPTRKDGSPRFLRYCPLCAKQDRELHGETYWHRSHQLIGMNVCPVHGCYLKNSTVVNGGKTSPMLKSAEEVVPQNEDIMIAGEIEFRVGKYMAEVFQSAVDMESEVTVGQFLHSQMANSEYRSLRGQQRNMELLHSDFTIYYKDLPNNYFTELWQIQKILTDDRTNFFEVCLLALFLDISPTDLVSRKLPEKTQQELFDEEIHRLHEQGLKYTEIAKQLGASYQLVKSIGCNSYGTYHKPAKTPAQKSKSPDWNKIDVDTLPLVKEAIQKLHGDRTTRPRKVTVSAVEKLLQLPHKRISSYLPLCRAEIEKHSESQEQYWAKEVVWAANYLLDTYGSFTIGKIEHLINVSRKDIEACLPYLCEYGDVGVVEQILKLL